MNWVKALAQDELPEGAQQVVKVDDRTLLLVHHEGQLYALENACPHMKLPLKGGKIKDHAIVCPWHRSAFDLASGTVKDWTPWPPGVGRVLAMVSKEKALPVFSTRVEDGSIWVEI
ncbi:MAG: (2Fe-2S)-binding protein [Shackletoniella antarctica]|jgi:nitrite reductase/ring-hydroxylating ferredoxin subunit|uniref:(2Fe-2S)-binding protein n=1 Tax=Shackletoniella antarctica TaxID=268115 RepID=A0A2W4WCL3_9CYAN|nr:MAG: (2Fe-2S)-binding protein [Shackletoniella antarctica]